MDRSELHIRVTDRDLAERARLHTMRVRLLATAAGFTALFSLVAVKLTLATVLMPAPIPARDIAPLVAPIPEPTPGGLAGSLAAQVMPHVHRAAIVDREGQILAISLPLANVYADPRVIIDPAEVAAKLAGVLPHLDEQAVGKRLGENKGFVYIARDVTPDQEMAINALGIPGISFDNSEKRRYPLGRTAAQLLGGVDIDDHGIAGVEKAFDRQLTSQTEPLRLSIDVRVQAVVHDEVARALAEFQGVGAVGLVMDVRTGEVIAMVSLPDYDANEYGRALPDARFNRAVTGMYEPGSTFKLQTAAMALEDGVAHVWDQFSTRPIHVGRFTITDMKTDHFAPWFTMAQVMAFSSNPGAAHIALDVGAERQQAWLRKLGFLAKVPVQLPESGWPIVPSPKNWGLSTVLTVGFGHGVAESPLAIVRGTAAAANGGILLAPTMLARPEGDPEPVAPVGGTPVMSPATSETLRKLLRLVVTKGIAQSAEVPGYFVGGKTGTAEKIGPHGGYLKHKNIAAFTSVYPMNDPRYAVYVMVDSPVGNKATHGWTTAGWVAAPVAARIIARTAPMLGLFPVTDGADAINAAIDMPLVPTPPAGHRALGPGNDPGDPGEGRVERDHAPHERHPRDGLVAEAAGAAGRPGDEPNHSGRGASALALDPALRHEALYLAPPDAGARHAAR